MPILVLFLSRQRRSCAHGFTLIEIMVVVVIMGVLAALLVPRLMGRTDDARIIGRHDHTLSLC